MEKAIFIENAKKMGYFISTSGDKILKERWFDDKRVDIEISNGKHGNPLRISIGICAPNGVWDKGFSLPCRASQLILADCLFERACIDLAAWATLEKMGEPMLPDFGEYSEAILKGLNALRKRFEESSRSPL